MGCFSSGRRKQDHTRTRENVRLSAGSQNNLASGIFLQRAVLRGVNLLEKAFPRIRSSGYILSRSGDRMVCGVTPCCPGIWVGGTPPVKKKKGGGVGITPLPPLAANSSFPAWPYPVFRVEPPA